MKAVFLALTLAVPAPAFATNSCEVVTRGEASKLLGVAVGKKAPQKADATSSRCLIKAANGKDSLRIELRTVAADDAEHLRGHTDEERGEEVQSLHDEPWYEVSAADAGHPNDHRLVIHRDRSVLTLDVHSTHQANVQATFESFWDQIAERLPANHT